MNQWTVYCHIHKDSGRKYVGLTKYSMMHRWHQHVANSRRSYRGYGHFLNAIRKYGKDAFEHKILEICTILKEANAAEKYWIEFYGTRNLEKGFNLAIGGDHIPHPIKNPWERPGFREKNIVANRLARSSPEEKIRASQASKLIWQDPIKREKIIAATKLAVSTPEAYEKASRITKEIKARPGMKEKHSQISKLMWESEEFRAKNAELWKNEEFREKCQSGLVHGANLNKNKTHCKHGHEFSLENTYVNPKGRRECRICIKQCHKISQEKAKANKIHKPKIVNTHCSKDY